MKNFIKDIGIAAGIFKDIRNARKEGETIEIHKTREIPVYKLGPGFYSTVEGCTLSWLDRETVKIISVVYDELPVEDKMRLAISPKDGEFIERGIFWRDMMALVLNEKQLHIAFRKILCWYIHIKRMDKGWETPEEANRISHSQ